LKLEALGSYKIIYSVLAPSHIPIDKSLRSGRPVSPNAGRQIHVNVSSVPGFGFGFGFGFRVPGFGFGSSHTSALGAEHQRLDVACFLRYVAARIGERETALAPWGADTPPPHAPSAASGRSRERNRASLNSVGENGSGDRENPGQTGRFLPQLTRDQVEVRGVDAYGPTTQEIRGHSTDDIACWFIDTACNGESFFVRHAYFTGAGDPYDKLKRALRAEVDEAAWASLYSTTSRPFDRPNSGKIAVKVINHYGDEVLKVFRI